MFDHCPCHNLEVGPREASGNTGARAGGNGGRGGWRTRGKGPGRWGKSTETSENPESSGHCVTLIRLEKGRWVLLTKMRPEEQAGISSWRASDVVLQSLSFSPESERKASVTDTVIAYPSTTPHSPRLLD